MSLRHEYAHVHVRQQPHDMPALSRRLTAFFPGPSDCLPGLILGLVYLGQGDLGDGTSTSVSTVGALRCARRGGRQ